MTATIEVRQPDGEWKGLVHLIVDRPEDIRVCFPIPEPAKPFDGVTPMTSAVAGRKMPPPPGQGGGA